jgi:hypothetical protein
MMVRLVQQHGCPGVPPGALIIRKITGNVSALERVVGQDQLTWLQAGHHLFVLLGVAGLVGVNERQVELLAGSQ